MGSGYWDTFYLPLALLICFVIVVSVSATSVINAAQVGHWHSFDHLP